MQISIDTSRDSKDDIIKAIKLLESIIGEHHITMPSRNIFESSSPDVSQPQAQASVFGNFFDNVAKSDAPVAPIKKQSIQRVEIY